MAKSIKQAQSLLACQLCDNEKAIKWKCVDCEILMCDKCKDKVHPRFKSAEEHRVISTKEIGLQDEIIGDFSRLGISSDKSISITCTVFNTYTTTLPAIHRIVSSPDGVVYFMNNVQQKRLIKAKLLRKSIKILQSVETFCFDFTLNKDGDLFYSPIGSGKLLALTSAGEIREVLDASPMLILGMHINKENEMIIGLREMGSPFPIKEFSTRQVSVLGTDFKRKFTLEYDKNGKRYFTYVSAIATTSNNTILVVDEINDDEGRVVSIKKDGVIVFTYNAQNSGSTLEKPFRPMDISVLDEACIIVADNNNHNLHFIDTRGHVLRLQNTLEMGIKNPQSIAIDDEGFLLLGCLYDKLFVVEISVKASD